MERQECRCWRGRSQGWLVFSLFCLVLASCYAVASARLVSGFQQVQSRDAEELALGSGQQESLAGSQAGTEIRFPKARSLRGERFLMEYFLQDYGDPEVDKHPSPPPIGRVGRPARPVEFHPVDFHQPP